MERCIGKSEGQPSKQGKSWQRDYASINVVRCHWTRQKSFNHDQCWETVKNCLRFRIIPTGPTVVLNKMSLHSSTTSDSPLDSPMSQDAPIQKEMRPIGRKAVKEKRGSTSSNDTAKFLQQIARNGTMRIELDMKKDADEKAMNEEYAREMEYICKHDIEKKHRETMTMDTSHMSPKTEQLKKLEQRDVMRTRLFYDDGPSNTDWLNDQNH
ncbi:unnamed protein product [Prunus armeniaca]